MKKIVVFISLGALLFVELLFASTKQKEVDYDQLLFVVNSKKFFYRDLFITGQAVQKVYSFDKNLIFFDLFNFNQSYLKTLKTVSMSNLNENRKFWNNTLSLETFYLDLIEQKSVSKAMLADATATLKRHQLLVDDPIYKASLKVLVTASYLKKRYGVTSRAYTAGDFAQLKRDNPKLSERQLKALIEREQYQKTVGIAKDFIQFAQSRFRIESFF